MRKLLILALTLISVTYAETRACTSYLITKGATTDGSNLISYAVYCYKQKKQLYFYQRAKWPAGAMQTIYDRSSNKPLGQIPYPAETYQVIGFMNEHQVTIGES